MTLMKELKELATLREAGTISEEEFKVFKEKLVATAAAGPDEPVAKRAKVGEKDGDDTQVAFAPKEEAVSQVTSCTVHPFSDTGIAASIQSIVASVQCASVTCATGPS